MGTAILCCTLTLKSYREYLWEQWCNQYRADGLYLLITTAPVSWAHGTLTYYLHISRLALHLKMEEEFSLTSFFWNLTEHTTWFTRGCIAQIHEQNPCMCWSKRLTYFQKPADSQDFFFFFLTSTDEWDSFRVFQCLLQNNFKQFRIKSTLTSASNISNVWGVNLVFEQDDPYLATLLSL